MTGTFNWILCIYLFISNQKEYFNWICSKILFSRSYKCKNGVKYFQESVLLPKTQFSELLVEEFGFNASSQCLGIDEVTGMGHLNMLWLPLTSSTDHFVCVKETEFSAPPERNL